MIDPLQVSIKNIYAQKVFRSSESAEMVLTDKNLAKGIEFFFFIQGSTSPAGNHINNIISQ
jgi:hypothetical protein